jgi:lipopolysaccharide heptosyltransferase II
MPEIDWQNVRKILVVRLRSIGDTALSTPSLNALRRFLPEAQIDILLEDWVAPVLDGFEAIDNVLTVSKEFRERAKLARNIRKTKYDVAINLHGGTTAGFFVRASGAKYRIGYEDYQYGFLYNRKLSSASDFWKQEKTHSAEQQLALLGFVGVPVEDRPKTCLTVTSEALSSLEKKLVREKGRGGEREQDRTDSQLGTWGLGLGTKFALLHPVAAFETKQWATENFAKVADFLSENGFEVIAIATKKEREVLEKLKTLSDSPVITFDDLSLPEITALADRSKIFVGNDSGIAHIAAAVQTPSVVIFGSSNRDHWRPWTDAPHEIVYEEFACQPCAGYYCKEFDEPKCILSVKIESVLESLKRLI